MYAEDRDKVLNIKRRNKYFNVFNFFFPFCPAEDPSENFVRLRDFVLAKLCQNLPCFSPEKLLEGFSQEMVTEAQQKLKINKVLFAIASPVMTW